MRAPCVKPAQRGRSWEITSSTRSDGRPRTRTARSCGSHSPKNANQHAEFLSQIGENSEAHKDAIDWFRTLPVWLDLPGLRVVHACWHDPSRKALEPFLDDAGCFTEEGVLESYRHGSVAHSAVEILLKGPEERLPAGIHFFDKDGHRREEVRLRWWDQNATTFRKAALGMEGRENEIPDTMLPKDYRYHEGKPVFFGHYWLKDRAGNYSAKRSVPRFQRC